MAKVISFITKGHMPDVVRYVRGIRSYFGLFHLVNYTVDYRLATLFQPMLVDGIEAKVKSKFGKDCLVETSDDITHRMRNESFYIIIQEGCRKEKYFVDFDSKGKPRFSSDVRQAYISQSLIDIKHTLTNVRINNGGKVRYVVIAMNLENTLQDPNFIILCKSKYSGKMLYLKERDQSGTVSLNPNLKSAKRFGYDDAVAMYESLKKSNKQNLYAVVVAPSENVKSSRIVEYFSKNNNKVAVSFHLPDYKSKDAKTKKNVKKER